MGKKIAYRKIITENDHRTGGETRGKKLRKLVLVIKEGGTRELGDFTLGESLDLLRGGV